MIKTCSVSSITSTDTDSTTKQDPSQSATTTSDYNPIVCVRHFDRIPEEVEVYIGSLESGFWGLYGVRERTTSNSESSAGECHENIAMGVDSYEKMKTSLIAIGEELKKQSDETFQLSDVIIFEELLEQFFVVGQLLGENGLEKIPLKPSDSDLSGAIKRVCNAVADNILGLSTAINEYFAVDVLEAEYPDILRMCKMRSAVEFFFTIFADVEQEKVDHGSDTFKAYFDAVQELSNWGELKKEFMTKWTECFYWEDSWKVPSVPDSHTWYPRPKIV